VREHTLHFAAHDILQSESADAKTAPPMRVFPQSRTMYHQQRT
jgi:hypothetical protein